MQCDRFYFTSWHLKNVVLCVFKMQIPFLCGHFGHGHWWEPEKIPDLEHIYDSLHHALLGPSALWYIPSEKIGQNFYPFESCFFVIYHQHWTGRSAFGPFLALLDHGGGLGGPGGVMRGLKTLKMTLSIGDHLRPWNAMFWLITISYTMFLWFWVKTGPSGPKKGRFWPK